MSKDYSDYSDKELFNKLDNVIDDLENGIGGEEYEWSKLMNEKISHLFWILSDLNDHFDEDIEDIYQECLDRKAERPDEIMEEYEEYFV